MRLIRFLTSRYIGGTLFGVIALGALLHPAVARAFSGAAAPAEGPVQSGADALSGGAAG